MTSQAHARLGRLASKSLGTRWSRSRRVDARARSPTWPWRRNWHFAAPCVCRCSSLRPAPPGDVRALIATSDFLGSVLWPALGVLYSAELLETLPFAKCRRATRRPPGGTRTRITKVSLARPRRSNSLHRSPAQGSRREGYAGFDALPPAARAHAAAVHGLRDQSLTLFGPCRAHSREGCLPVASCRRARCGAARRSRLFRSHVSFMRRPHRKLGPVPECLVRADALANTENGRPAYRSRADASFASLAPAVCSPGSARGLFQYRPCCSARYPRADPGCKCE